MILFERMPYRNILGMFLLFAYPIVAFFLLLGISDEAVTSWPYWLMGLSAIALAVLAMLPHHAKLRNWAGPVSVVVIVLFALWGLAAPSNWSVGLFYGIDSWIIMVIAVVLTVGPAVAAVVCLLLDRTRSLVLDNFMAIAILVGFVTFIGYMVPIQVWDPVRGSSPPWAMAFAPAAFAVSAVAS